MLPGADPENDINLLILETSEPDAGWGGCLASAQPTNCELCGPWLAPRPLSNRLSKDIAGPSVRPFIVLLACLKSAAEIVLRSCFWNSYEKPMSVCFPANVSIGASLCTNGIVHLSGVGSVISLHLDNELACVSAEICTLRVSLGKRGKEKQLCAKSKYIKEHWSHTVCSIKELLKASVMVHFPEFENGSQ